MTNKEKFKTLKKIHDLKCEFHKKNIAAQLSLSDDIQQKITVGEEVVSLGRSIFSLIRTYKDQNV